MTKINIIDCISDNNDIEDKVKFKIGDYVFFNKDESNNTLNIKEGKVCLWRAEIMRKWNNESPNITIYYVIKTSPDNTHVQKQKYVCYTKEELKMTYIKDILDKN